MTDKKTYAGHLVFGLDIGTRSIVGTVGYKRGKTFYVVAQQVKEHDTRAMLDGQIHDIAKVGETISYVKSALEEKTGRSLTEVCIAAAGRVLKTVTTHAEISFTEDKEVTKEDIYALDSLCAEKAFEKFIEENDTDMKFYCVGYTIVKYYLNDYPMSNLESHRAKTISADIIATFLPDEVVDGLYRAVELAGLQVASLTLEPIAAMQVAIPEMYRMLNIALVDVGAGTSDICITKDGSVIAYGMIPAAGDGLTEEVAKHCLVDFTTAEMIKRQAVENENITFVDIMGLQQTMPSKALQKVLQPQINSMAKSVADKIKELNGGKPVSAVFIVGGGGKFTGYTERVAKELSIQSERVALRGEEVMRDIEFLEEGIVKDSLLVTPIGICVNFYEQNNNFIYVSFNGKRVKLYDNNRLAVVDAAMQANFPNEGLFPKRGRALNFTVNGAARIIRGELGEAAVMTANGSTTHLYGKINANDIIVVTESTVGADASMEIGKLPEYHSTIQVTVNDQKIVLPKFASVNGKLQSEFYNIKEEDDIEMLSYYTVKQISEFMDVLIDTNMNIYVNNQLAGFDTPVYENFSVQWTMGMLVFDKDKEKEKQKNIDWNRAQVRSADSDALVDNEENFEEETPDTAGEPVKNVYMNEDYEVVEGKKPLPFEEDNEKNKKHEQTTNAISSLEVHIVVNGRPVKLSGRPAYLFASIFDYIDFDLTTPKGKNLVTKVNGKDAEYMAPILQGDIIEIYWKE